MTFFESPHRPNWIKNRGENPSLSVRKFGVILGLVFAIFRVVFFDSNTGAGTSLILGYIGSGARFLTMYVLLGNDCNNVWSHHKGWLATKKPNFAVINETQLKWVLGFFWLPVFGIFFTRRFLVFFLRGASAHPKLGFFLRATLYLGSFVEVS